MLKNVFAALLTLVVFAGMVSVPQADAADKKPAKSKTVKTKKKAKKDKKAEKKDDAASEQAPEAEGGADEAPGDEAE
ncbi:MAG: hypothetical protein K8F91_13210 [Candidatus Obscuribacterales bacterium]|nr:hypothetical protein [Candidatus Obscuribacterales bacterium]